MEGGLIIMVFFFFVFLGPHPWHMEASRLGVQTELQLPAYTRATATWDLSRICSLCHTSLRCRIFTPLSKARDQTHSLMVSSWIHFCCAKNSPLWLFLKGQMEQAVKNLGSRILIKGRDGSVPLTFKLWDMLHDPSFSTFL